MSARSFPRYKKFGFLFRPLFASFTGVGAQNETDAARLREIGCRPEAVRVVGNLKFDAAKLDERRPLDVGAMLRQLGVAAGRADSGRRQHARRRGKNPGGKRRGVCARGFRNFFSCSCRGISSGARKSGGNCANAA